MRSRPARSAAGRVDSASHRPSGRVVVEAAALGERCPRRCEQAAVERRHAQIARAAPGMGQAGDRAQRVPESRRRRRTFGDVAQRFEAVALAIDRVPQRHECARLGKQQKQDAIDDRQCLFEPAVDVHGPESRLRARRYGRPSDRGPRHEEGPQHLARRREHAVAEQSAHSGGVAVRRRDKGVQRPRIARLGGERRRTGDGPEGGEGRRMIDREIQVELDVTAGVETAAIHDPQMKTVEEQTPGGRPSRRLSDREPPERIERLAPRRDQQRHRAAARPARRGEGGVCRLDRGRRVEP